MPYDIEGFIEVRHAGPAECFNSWCVAVHLLPFNLRGDMVSNRLFGLSKCSSIEAFFKNRGLPPDPSGAVARWYQENERFVEIYSDGDFGHTFATWQEIKAVELAAHELKASPWTTVFQLIRAMDRTGENGAFLPENIRVVVAANW